MPLAKILLALAVAVLAAVLLLQDSPRAVQGVNLSPPDSVASLEAALRANTISPYRWLELAEGYEQAGNLTKAELCMQQALKLGPDLPPVWIRAAAFDFRRGRTEDALRLGIRAQDISPDADDFLFQYYDGFVHDTPLVIRLLDQNRRAVGSYLRYMMARKRPAEATLVYERLSAFGAVDRKTVIAYTTFLLDQREFTPARNVWFQQNGNPPGVVFNGGFEQEISGSSLDWQLPILDGAEFDRDESTARTGKFSLRARFAGEQNLELSAPFQTAVVQPGEYLFTAWLKTDGISTDQGIGVCLSDAEISPRVHAETEYFTGTKSWTELRARFAVSPATNLLRIALCRHRSQKFDNKLSGTAWLDDVSLAPIRGAAFRLR